MVYQGHGGNGVHSVHAPNFLLLIVAFVRFPGALNALFLRKVSPANSSWTWVRGSSAFGSTATFNNSLLGIESAYTDPSPRTIMARSGTARSLDRQWDSGLVSCSTVSADGEEMFVYSGACVAACTDLFRFRKSTQRWTWYVSTNLLLLGNLVAGGGVCVQAQGNQRRFAVWREHVRSAASSPCFAHFAHLNFVLCLYVGASASSTAR